MSKLEFLRHPLQRWNSTAELPSARVLLAIVAVCVVGAFAPGHRAVDADDPPKPGLYVVNADRTGLARLGEEPTETLGYWGPAWSPDGTKLAVTRTDTQALVLLSADGMELTQLTHNDRNNYLPAWSADGTKLVFMSQDGSDTATAEIAIVDADGSGERVLTDDDAWDYGASFSPDGERIVFGSERDGRWRIWMMNADGTDQHPLPTEAHGNAPAWSPDGTTIVFTSDRDGDDDLWMAKPDGRGQRNLTGNTAHDDNAVWTADGQRLVFSSDRTGRTEIWTIDIAGEQPRQLTDDTALHLDNVASLSPDGSLLAFTARIAE